MEWWKESKQNRKQTLKTSSILSPFCRINRLPSMGVRTHIKKVLCHRKVFSSLHFSFWHPSQCLSQAAFKPDIQLPSHKLVLRFMIKLLKNFAMWGTYRRRQVAHWFRPCTWPTLSTLILFYFFLSPIECKQVFGKVTQPLNGRLPSQCSHLTDTASEHTGSGLPVNETKVKCVICFVCPVRGWDSTGMRGWATHKKTLHADAEWLHSSLMRLPLKIPHTLNKKGLNWLCHQLEAFRSARQTINFPQARRA